MTPCTESGLERVRTDRPKVTLAELLRAGGPVLPSGWQVAGMVREVYARVLMRAPDADGARRCEEKAMVLARQGASDEEIRAFLRRELVRSSEGQVIAAVNEHFESVLGHPPEARGSWHEQALAWRGQGVSLEEIHQRLDAALH